MIARMGRRGAICALIIVCACGGGSSGPMAPLLPDMEADGRCRRAATGSSPLVTEWPASEKANLEAMVQNGAVVVAYSGCTMRLLPECQVPGGYAWQRTTPASDVMEIADENELYAKLPLGAAALSGELKRSGQLSIATHVTGHLRLREGSVNDVGVGGPCAQATHIVSAVSVGAFALARGGAAQARAAASVTGFGEAGGSQSQTASLVRSAGDPKSCNESTAEAPHQNCNSPLQVFLTAIPGRTPEEGPVGTSRADFVSTSAESRWDVFIDDEVACTTPCTKYINPSRPVELRTREEKGFLFKSTDKVQLDDVSKAARGPVRVRAYESSTGKFMAGMYVGGTGVLLLMMGGAFALTCGEDDEFGAGPSCTTAGVLAGIGVVAVAGGLWLWLKSRPRVEVDSIDSY
jgi:transposase